MQISRINAKATNIKNWVFFKKLSYILKSCFWYIFFNNKGFACLQWQFEFRSGFNIFRLKSIYTIASAVPIYKRCNIIPKVKRHEHRPTGFVSSNWVHSSFFFWQLLVRQQRSDNKDQIIPNIWVMLILWDISVLQ